MYLEILMRDDLNMRTGKMVAQGSHAAMMVAISRMANSENGDLRLDAEDAHELRSFLKHPDVEVSFAHTQDMLLAGVEGELDFHVVVDNGLTEFRGNKTMTCGAGGIFHPQGEYPSPQASLEYTPSSARQYLIMSRENSPSKQAAIAMGALGCLREIEKSLLEDEDSGNFVVSRALHEDFFEWLGKGYPKIGLQIPNHQDLTDLRKTMEAAHVSCTLVEYQGCMMLVTAPLMMDKLAPFTRSLKLL
jgi:PTH2 family peptidyl-tRNA hydrolase